MEDALHERRSRVDCGKGAFGRSIATGLCSISQYVVVSMALLGLGPPDLMPACVLAS